MWGNYDFLLGKFVGIVFLLSKKLHISIIFCTFATGNVKSEL